MLFKFHNFISLLPSDFTKFLKIPFLRRFALSMAEVELKPRVLAGADRWGCIREKLQWDLAPDVTKTSAAHEVRYMEALLSLSRCVYLQWQAWLCHFVNIQYCWTNLTMFSLEAESPASRSSKMAAWGYISICRQVSFGLQCL